VEAARRPRITAEPITAPPVPRELDARRLVRRGLAVVAALVVLGLVALLAPGLGEVRTLLGRASPGWLALAIALEVASSLSYVAMFRPAFCKRMSWRSTFEISLSGLAVGSIVPTSGAAGVALGAWFLSRSGMPAQVVARRSVAFLLVKSSVNFAAVAVIGVLLWLGVGPELSPLLTILPAGLAAATLVGVPLAASRLASAGARHARGKIRSVAVAISEGVAEAGRLLRGRDVMLVAGAVGYWIFDNLVLLATFHAFGISPAVMVVLMAYLIGQLGGALPLPGGLGGIDGGLIGAMIVYGIDPAAAAAAVLAYRVILFWVPIVMGAPAFWSLRRGLNDSARPDLCLPVPVATSAG
jgi:glycosyltransferase 2 family protein